MLILKINHNTHTFKTQDSPISACLQKKKVHKEPKTGEKADDSHASHPTAECGRRVPVTLWGVGDEGEKCWRSIGSHKKSDFQML